MPLQTKDIQKLATLSRLSFAPEQLPAFASEFESILSFVDKIQQLDTKGVPPLTNIANIETSPERPDVVTAPNNREALQANAPQKEMGFFVVPKIVE
jgi:aspartyl-tRNA(Asn)/glutamyl-tRNA(Gln) amidotransferase subunit C